MYALAQAVTLPVCSWLHVAESRLHSVPICAKQAFCLASLRPLWLLSIATHAGLWTVSEGTCTHQILWMDQLRDQEPLQALPTCSQLPLAGKLMGSRSYGMFRNSLECAETQIVLKRARMC